MHDMDKVKVDKFDNKNNLRTDDIVMCAMLGTIQLLFSNKFNFTFRSSINHASHTQTHSSFFLPLILLICPYAVVNMCTGKRINTLIYCRVI